MILYLGNKLSKHGFTPTSVETLGVRLEEHFRVERHSSVRNPLLRFLHMIYLIVKFRKADFLLIDTYSAWSFWYAVFSSQLARLFGLSYIPIARGGSLPKRLTRSPFWSRILLKYSKDVVCPSGYLHHHMNKFYHRSYKLIPNFIDIQNYPFKERTIESSIRLLWVRSFHEIYNPCLAVDVVCRLKEKGIDVQLAMVGPDKDGSLEKTKEYAGERGIQKNIKFTGRLSKSDWITMAADYDVFINTTNVDNTPVSVMEAMALGMIVISTNVGGMPYLFSDKIEGFLVAPNDSSVFVQQVLKLRNNEHLTKTISRNARLKAEDWDWNVVEKKWLKLLNF